MKGMTWSKAERIGREKQARCRETNGKEPCKRMCCPRCYPKIRRNPEFTPAPRKAGGDRKS